MKSNLNECLLGEIVSLVIDHRGLTPKKLGGDWAETGYRALSAKNVKTGQIVQPESIRFVSEEMYKKWMTEEIVQGDILITSEAPFGQVYQWDSYEKIVLSQRLFAIRITKEFDAKYIYYYMTSDAFQGEMYARATGTTVIGLRQPELLKCVIKYPPISIQRKIGSFLYSIESKIKINERINQNLEEQARALFQSMFISAEKDSSWKNGTFSDLIESTLGGDWGKDFPSGNYTEMVYCIRGADIPEVKAGNKGKMPTRYILSKNYSAKQLLPGDIVVEISGGSPTQSTGRVAAVSQSLLDRYDKGMVCTNFCRAIKPKLGYSMFVYYYWQYLYERNVFFSYENGTTGIKNLDLSGFITTEEIVIPPLDLIRKFDDYCQIVFDQTFANGYENERLSLLRDTLLPKLMSGELDVSEIEL